MDNSDNIGIGLLSGDIIEVIEADVCVSSVHRSKNLNVGPLASHILRHGGQDIQEELNEKAQGTELEHGQVVMTSPGKLCSKFRQLMLVCVYTWRRGNEEVLRKSLTECLRLANSNGYESIILPPLGMGGLGYPPEVVAMAIIEAVVCFRSSGAASSLKCIYICISTDDPASKQEFVRMLQSSLTEGDDPSLDEAFRYDNSIAESKQTFYGPAKPSYATTGGAKSKPTTKTAAAPNATSNSSPSGQQMTKKVNFGNNLPLANLLTFSASYGLVLFEIKPIIDPQTGTYGAQIKVAAQPGKNCSIV